MAFLRNLSWYWGMMKVRALRGNRAVPSAGSLSACLSLPVADSAR